MYTRIGKIMSNSELEIPTATEIPIIIVVAEPFVETNRFRWKCPFSIFMCTLFLGMFAWLMFVFWNQGPR